MKYTNDLISDLNQILQEKYPDRIKLVTDFQNRIFYNKDINVQDLILDEILSELAYDLDFYEPNEVHRMESPSYYGEKRLEEIILSGIQKIEQHLNKSCNI